MTPKQKAFAEHFAASGNATQSAVQAGYSSRTAYSSGQRLLKNVEVRNYLNELEAKLSSARIASAEEVQTYWSDVLRDGSERTSDRLRAGLLLSRSTGQSLPQADQEPETAEKAAQGDFAIVYIPVSIGDTPTAALMPSGEVVPLHGHEADDLLLYCEFALPSWSDYEIEEDDPVEDQN